jgi:hypothetical protein
MRFPVPYRVFPFLFAASGCVGPAAAPAEVEQAALLREEPAPECPVVTTTLDIDVPRVQVSGDLRLDGALPPSFANQTARIELRSKTLGVVELGHLHEGGYSRWVVPGVYDVHYVHVAGDQVPRNPDTVLVEDVSLVAATDLDIDVPTAAVSGDITLNGAAPPASVYERGEIRLRDRTTKATLTAGSSTAGAYSVLVVAGLYDVTYHRAIGGGLVPVNGDAVLVEEVAADGPTSLDVDIPAVERTGTFTINGALAPASVYENATVSLRDTRTGDVFPLGQTRHQSYEVVLVPGTYDVIYSHLIGSTIVPRNEAAVVAKGVVLTTGGELAIDIPTVEVTGAVSLDGAAFPQSIYNRARIHLQGAGADAFPIASSDEATYAARVVPGTYSLVYQKLISTGVVPENPWAVISTGHKIVKPLFFRPQVVLDVAVTSGVVNADFTIWGQPPYDSVYENAAIFAGDVELGRTKDAGGSVRLVPGEYDLRYAHLIGELVPANKNARLGTVSPTVGVKPIGIDLQPGSIAGDFTQAGAPFPGAADQLGRISLRDVATGELVELGTTEAAGYELPLLGGKYEIVYEHVAGQGVVANRGARLGCVTFAPPAPLVVAPILAL